MIETPTAVFAAKTWTPFVDFFYVGTSDLLSALSAYQRNQQEALQRTLLSDASCTVFSFLKQLMQKSKVTVCGEIVGEPWAIAYLRHFGFQNFVVPAHRIGTTANFLQMLTKEACATYTRKIFKIKDEVNRLESARRMILDILYG